MAPGDIRVERVRRTTRTENGQVKHVLKVRVCNQRNRRIWFKPADNPWLPATPPATLGPKLIPTVLRPDGSPDPGATRRRAFDDWVNPETGDKSPFELGPAGSATACKDFEVVYDFEPSGVYLDLFCCDEDGDNPEEAFSAHVTDIWGRIETAWYGRGPGPTYACVLPLPFPMSMERAAGGPLKVVVTHVEGLPPSHELVHAFPPLGTPHTLAMGDRESHAVLVLRQVGPMDGPATVRMHFGWLDPPQVREWPHRHVGFELRGPGATRAKRKTEQKPPPPPRKRGGKR